MVAELRKNEDFEQLLERSRTKSVLIFKHSTQCPVSDAAYQEFLRFIETAGELLSGLVLVIENRALSNTIAARLGVPHQSPQAIALENGQSIWAASHWSITMDSLNKVFKDHAQSPK